MDSHRLCSSNSAMRPLHQGWPFLHLAGLHMILLDSKLISEFLSEYNAMPPLAMSNDSLHNHLLLPWDDDFRYYRKGQS